MVPIAACQPLIKEFGLRNIDLHKVPRSVRSRHCLQLPKALETRQSIGHTRVNNNE